jgi:hypothetical protein
VILVDHAKPAHDEVISMSFSHDYPDDTQLTYTRSGNNAHLVLSFQSEDPDMGTEEMEYNSDGGESFAELLSDARLELTSYLDRQDTSSFYEQQGVSPKDGIHDLDDYYGEFSRTSLYAFENAMRAAEHEKPSVMAELKRLSSRSVPEKDSIGMER